MNIHKDPDGAFSLTGMSEDDLKYLSIMIQGCCIVEKRVFYNLVKIISGIENESRKCQYLRYKCWRSGCR